MSGFLSAIGISPYAGVIQPATWRGIAFVITEVTNTPNRLTAVHVYPYSKTGYPSVEDLGQAPEYIDVRGFLASPIQMFPEQVYGDTELGFRSTLQSLYGAGIFVHPTLGKKTVFCINASMSYSKESLGIINISLRFVVVDPNANATTSFAKANTQFNLLTAAQNALAKVGTAFTNAVGPLLAGGVGIAIGSALVAAAYIATAVSVCTDAASTANETKGLGFIGDDTVTLGRYNSGNLTQAPAALSDIDTTQPIDTVLTQGTAALRAAQVTAVAAVNAATAALGSAASSLTATSVSTFPATVQTAVQALAAAQNDPVDQRRLLTAMASVSYSSPVAGSALTANLIAWTALIVLAETLSSYQPTSSTDAANVLSAVTPLYQTAISTAGDVPDIVSFQALTQIFSGVWADLTTRGSLLPPLIVWNVPDQMPAATLAQLLYQTGDRTDDLILRVDTPHPLFFPSSFVSLSY